MQTYKVKVRLAGAVTNEVVKENVTAAEVFILRAMHGGDAVAVIEKQKMDKRSHAEERKRLYHVYANPEHNMPDAVKKKTDMIRGLFGHDSMDLPVKLPEEAEVPKRTVVKEDDKTDLMA